VSRSLSVTLRLRFTLPQQPLDEFTSISDVGGEKPSRQTRFVVSRGAFVDANRRSAISHPLPPLLAPRSPNISTVEKSNLAVGRNGGKSFTSGWYPRGYATVPGNAFPRGGTVRVYDLRRYDYRRVSGSPRKPHAQGAR